MLNVAQHIAMYTIVNILTTTIAIIISFIIYDKYRDHKSSSVVHKVFEYLQFLDEKYGILKRRNSQLKKLNKELLTRLKEKNE